MAAFALLWCSSCQAGGDVTADERPASQESEAASESDSQEDQDGELQSAPSSERCNDEVLLWSVAQVLQNLEESEADDARLRELCSAAPGDSVQLRQCGCDRLEDFLVQSEAVEQWMTKCCVESTTCEQSGRCGPVDMTPEALLETVKEGAQVAQGMMEPGLACVDVSCAATDEGCAASRGCARRGECEVDNNQCAPATEQHCLESEECQEFGQCSLSRPGGRCVLDSDRDCRESEECRVRGACEYDEVQEWCAPGSPEHCEAAEVCETRDRCHFDGLDEGEYIEERPHGWRPNCYSKVAETVEEAKRRTENGRLLAAAGPVRQLLEHLVAEGATVNAIVNKRMTQVESMLYGFDGSYVDIRADIDDDGRSLRYRVDCEKFIEAARDILPTRTLEQGEVEITVEPYRLSTDEVTLLDEEEVVCATMGSVAAELVSWVGPVLSMELTRASGGNRGSYHHVWSSLDIESGEEVSLDHMVESQSVMTAIRQDPWVQERIESVERQVNEVDDAQRAADFEERLQAFDEAGSLAELDDALAGIVAVDETFRNRVTRRPFFEGFAFADYDWERGKVAMRISLAIAGEDHRLKDVITLGVWVEPRPEFVEAFEQADEEGWLIPDVDDELPEFHIPEHYSVP